MITATKDNGKLDLKIRPLEYGGEERTNTGVEIPNSLYNTLCAVSLNSGMSKNAIIVRALEHFFIDREIIIKQEKDGFHIQTKTNNPNDGNN